MPVTPQCIMAFAPPGRSMCRGVPALVRLKSHRFPRLSGRSSHDQLRRFPRAMYIRSSADSVTDQVHPFTAQPVLDVQDLVVSFNSRPLFSSISLQLAESEIVFVKGPSGIGKSRFARAVAHLDRSWTGTVQLGGLPADKVGYPHWRRRVCYVSDSPPPLTTSAEVAFEGVLEYSTRQGLGFSVASSLNTLRDVAARLGLTHEVLQRPFTLLSAGERQRVALSWAIALRPEVSRVQRCVAGVDQVCLRLALFSSVTRRFGCAKSSCKCHGVQATTRSC